MTPNEVLTLSEKEFHKLVDDDLRRDSPNRDHRSDVSEETSRALRSPAAVDRWHSKLARMAHQVGMELETRVERYLAALADLRGKILEQEQALLDAEDPAVVTAIRRHILSLRIEVEKLEVDHHSAQARTLRFRTGLDQHLLEAQYLRDGVRDRLYDSVVTKERDRYASKCRDLESRVTVLEEAITNHRALMKCDDIEPTNNDRRLWATLDDTPSVMVCAPSG